MNGRPPCPATNFVATIAKRFEIILTFSEYDKGEIACPNCGGKNVHQEAAEFFGVTSKKS
jgi:hypothetical protein